jgi:peptidoglycan L-alanyl-D-glutamate endopeptidase CwlK
MPSFGAASKLEFNKAHPKLRQILSAAIEKVDFKILQATRGRAQQERAFLTGHSKAHFGQSAHNYVPSIAVDLLPAPYDWNDRPAFVNLYKIIGFYDPATHRGVGLAKELMIPLRCGLDWHMDGVNPGDDWDGGHYELHPWRDWAKKVHLVED